MVSDVSWHPEGGLSPWWQESVVEGGTSHLGGQEAEREQRKKGQGKHVPKSLPPGTYSFHEIPPLKFLRPLRLGHHLRTINIPVFGGYFLSKL